MKIYKFLHSCLLVEGDGEKILFDPGFYSFIEEKIKPESFTNLSGILITHEHNDHLDRVSLKTILQNNPGAAVLTNSGVKNLLEKDDIQVTAVDDGKYKIGNFEIEIIPAEHEKLLFSVPQNTAYLINNKFLNPGDSLDKSLLQFKNIEVLALPVATVPWAKAVEVGEFTKLINPKIVIPVHDGGAKDIFLERQYQNYEKYFSQLGIKFQPLRNPDDFIEI